MNQDTKVCVIGLGAMGLGTAITLLRAGFDVMGCDVSEAARSAFADAGGFATDSPSEAVAGAKIVLTMVVNGDQVDRVLFGEGGAASALTPSSVLIQCATVSPDMARRIEARLGELQIRMIDAPISGGTAKAADGTLTVMASGAKVAFEQAEPVLNAMAEKVYRLGDAAGPGSTVKMINQHLAGIHIAAACEAMAFGIREGADPHTLYDIISNAAGSSWMFQNRVPHILEGDYSPKSAVDIFVKDLGIVSDTARSDGFPTPMAAAALQLFLMARASGMGRDDDSSIFRVFAALSGIDQPGKPDNS
jgi:L-threonate 2-dehydrogenase